jgi:mannose-6-phosphate isomerase-like protein (cupin superfamily)
MSTAAIVDAADAETLSGRDSAARLLLDAPDTGGSVAAVEIRLVEGADGAAPHYHTRSDELFYVAEGALQVMAGEQIRVLTAGSALVVPRRMPHAFAAAPGCGEGVRLFIALTPGVRRFDYFRLLARLERGEATGQELADSQERFDNVFVDAPHWQAARAEARRGR